ncbi:hypothetical protein BHM03_00050078 [Ensete ventricosum]|nr:hypothetical protein BHM03_00050078 [Ensete ventricosum]
MYTVPVHLLTLLAASALFCCRTLVRNNTKFTPTPKNASVANPWFTAIDITIVIAIMSNHAKLSLSTVTGRRRGWQAIGRGADHFRSLGAGHCCTTVGRLERSEEPNSGMQEREKRGEP